MTDRALSEAAMLDSLRDLHLPATAPGGSWAELAVVVAFAALVALILASVFRLVSIQMQRPEPQGLIRQIEALQGLAPTDRRVALLHILREHAPARHAALRQQLYRPDGSIDLATLEEEVAQFV